ncbi:MAG TPA: VWA domain-containing protein [Vicinamibacterales bacterium]|nr:VWA domain-containing protein [Vicinamibacterales bacterium]
MRTKGRLIRTAVAPLALIACRALLAAPMPQDPRQIPRTDKPFTSGVEITSVTATVTDKDGRLVTGLGREAFEVYEDGERQTVTQFTNERVPIGLGVLLDISDSMFGKRIQDARAAVERFLFTLLDEGDEFFLSAFNHRPRPLTGWTRERTEIGAALAGLRPSGGTAIYDALIDSLPLIDRRDRQRAAVLIISDGADTASTATLRDVQSALWRSDAFVYAIAIDSPEPQPINTRVNPQSLREITNDSGGRTEIVRSSADLDTATARIAEELNSQYVLGYSSTHGADGKFHSIRVRIANSDDKVRARNGYIATPVRHRSQ